MPRDGSGVYSKPSGTTAAPNTTIESAKFNSVVDDLVTDANAPRPLTSGGTGATSVSAARLALGVDVAQTYAVKTGNYTAVLTDNNAFHNFTGATPTLSLTAAATLGASWHYDGYASGGPVIIDPNASELINGASTVTVPQGCKFSIKCDASAFICVITTSQNYVDARVSNQSSDDLIINGCFDLSQRATTQAVAGYGSLDRWVVVSSGGTISQSRQDFTVGDTLGSCSKPYFGRQTVSGQSATSHYMRQTQRFEDVRSYAGQTITVLGWARRSSGSGDMSVEIEQNFGTGGSPSAAVTAIGATKVTLTTLWVPFAINVSVPNITGKTLGSNNNHFLGLNFWSSAGSDFNARTGSLGLQTINVDLFGVHIRKGTVPIEAANYYSPPPIWQTTRDCQRYYEASQYQAGGYYNAATAFSFVPITFQTWKRANPSMTNLGNVANTNVANISFNTPLQGKVGIDLTPASIGGFAIQMNWSADAEL